LRVRLACGWLPATMFPICGCDRTGRNEVTRRLVRPVSITVEGRVADATLAAGDIALQPAAGEQRVTVQGSAKVVWGRERGTTPLANAEVAWVDTVSGAPRTATTNARGEYTLQRVDFFAEDPASSHRVQAIARYGEPVNHGLLRLRGGL
jgi:hypothetical protein